MVQLENEQRLRLEATTEVEAVKEEYEREKIKLIEYIQQK